MHLGDESLKIYCQYSKTLKYPLCFQHTKSVWQIVRLQMRNCVKYSIACIFSHQDGPIPFSALKFLITYEILYNKRIFSEKLDTENPVKIRTH